MLVSHNFASEGANQTYLKFLEEAKQEQPQLHSGIMQELFIRLIAKTSLLMSEVGDVLLIFYAMSLSF